LASLEVGHDHIAPPLGHFPSKDFLCDENQGRLGERKRTTPSIWEGRPRALILPDRRGALAKKDLLHEACSPMTSLLKPLLSKTLSPSGGPSTGAQVGGEGRKGKKLDASPPDCCSDGRLTSCRPSNRFLSLGSGAHGGWLV